MKKLRSCLYRFWPLFTLGFAAVGVLAAASHFSGADEFDWPAWVQAVGSIAAILAAVWVSADQTKQQQLRDERREATEIEGVIRSIKAEVEMSLVYMEREILPVLEHIAPGDPIAYTFRLHEYPFPIFDALIPKLGMLTAKIRQEIIQAYAQAKSLAITTTVHNELCDEFEGVEIRYRATPPLAGTGEFAGSLRALTDYGTTFRFAFGATQNALQALLKTLSDAYPDQQD